MKQITVITEDHPGIVADITSIMAANNINIETMEAQALGSHGIVIFSVDHYDKALRALRDANYNAFSEDVIIIKLKDEPGALAKIAVRFKEAGINIKSLRIVKRDRENSLVAISMERTDTAMELIKDVLVS